MQCLSLGNVKNLQPYLLVQKGFCAEKSHPHFADRACKGIFRPRGSIWKSGTEAHTAELGKQSITWKKDMVEGPE